jgi:hypothetical protein
MLTIKEKKDECTIAVGPFDGWTEGWAKGVVRLAWGWTEGWAEGVGRLAWGWTEGWAEGVGRLAW